MPVAAVLLRGGAGRTLAALLLARLPRPELPLPTGWQRADSLAKAPPPRAPVDWAKLLDEQLVAVCGKGESRDDVHAAAQQLPFRCRRSLPPGGDRLPVPPAP